MSPITGKRKSADDDAYDVTTPTGSPPTKKLRITRNQKQALIDNLQLESMFHSYFSRHLMLTSQSPNAPANFEPSMPSKQATFEPVLKDA